MEQEAPDLVPLQRHCPWSKSLHENSRNQLGSPKARTTLLKQVRKAILFQLCQPLLRANIADIWEERPNLQVSLGKKDNSRIYIQHLGFSYNCLRDWSGVLLSNQHILDAPELLRTQKSSVACWSIRGPPPLQTKAGTACYDQENVSNSWLIPQQGKIEMKCTSNMPAFWGAVQGSGFCHMWLGALKNWHILDTCGLQRTNGSSAAWCSARDSAVHQRNKRLQILKKKPSNLSDWEVCT